MSWSETCYDVRLVYHMLIAALLVSDMKGDDTE